MQLVILTCFTEFLAATSNDCPPLQYYNGKSCTPCSKCPRGFGVRTQCSALKDTECQECWLGHDYSGTTNMKPCIKCYDGSNCPSGNFRVISNCTRYSPTVCSGCTDGYYFDKSVGLKGGCEPCTAPCSINKVETRKCITAHDRKCEMMPSTASEIWVPSTVGTNISKRWSFPSGTTTDGTEASTTEKPDQEYLPKGIPIVEQPLLWGLLCGILAAIGMAAIAARLVWKRGKLKKKKIDHSKTSQHTIPLMGQRGLDTLIKDISTLDRKYITEELNKKDTAGYYYWKFVADNLGLGNESQNWGQLSTNPAETLLEAFAVKEQSTVRKIIEASRTAGLTLLASELERKFSSTNQS